MKTKSAWLIVKLRDVCEVRKGTPITRSKVKPGNIPVIAGGQKPAYYHNEANRDGNIITVSASGAYAGYVQFFDTPIFASDCTTIESLDESLLLTEFVYYALKAQQDRIYKLQHGAGQPHVYPKDLEIIKIPLPPLPEQRRIVAILRKADELRQLRRRANQRARDLLPALFYEMFGGNYGREWPIVTLGDLADTVQYGLTASATPDSSGTRFIRITDIDDYGNLGRAEPAYVSVNDDDLAKYLLQDGDLLIARSGATAGKAYVHRDIGEKAIFASYLIRLQLDRSRVLPEFLDVFVRTNLYWSQVYALLHTAAQPNINAQELRSIKLPLPPIKYQQEFALLVRKTTATQDTKRSSSNFLDTLFASLLARAFTGELTAAWRETHADELRAAAAERDRLLGLAKKPEQVTVDVLGDTQALEKALDALPSVAHALASSAAQAALPAFTRSAEALRPHLQPLAEEANRDLAAALEPLADETKRQIIANVRPLTEALRARYAPEFADLAKKIAELASLQLEEPIPRREIEARVLAVAADGDTYLTLPELAADWRLNHFPRQTIQEAVDMLVVRGQLRPATLKLETGDPGRPYALAAAYTPVRAEDKITADEIDL